MLNSRRSQEWLNLRMSGGEKASLLGWFTNHRTRWFRPVHLWQLVTPCSPFQVSISTFKAISPNRRLAKDGLQRLCNIVNAHLSANAKKSHSRHPWQTILLQLVRCDRLRLLNSNALRPLPSLWSMKPTKGDGVRARSQYPVNQSKYWSALMLFYGCQAMILLVRQCSMILHENYSSVVRFSRSSTTT
jgi:hypothetical protein